MSRESLLSDLCTICHENPIKYTCPRCRVHTCSLSCVKKHKQWAQCSGVRDPAEYRKRTELATASSIDKDYNFITRVERSLQRADNDALDRGIDLAPSRRGDARQQKSKLELEMEERAITVNRAPKGFTRSRQNKTHRVPLQQCIMWTTEWVLPSGSRYSGQGLENRTVEELFSRASEKHQESLKRKRNDDGGARPNPRNESFSAEAQHLQDGAYFYLHKPDVPANITCLIPLQRTETLGSQLKGRTLTEYPTLYVMAEPPDKLADPYITEAAYAARHAADTTTDVPSKIPS